MFADIDHTISINHACATNIKQDKTQVIYIMVTIFDFECDLFFLHYISVDRMACVATQIGSFASQQQ